MQQNPRPIQTHNNPSTFHHHLILFFTPRRLPPCHALPHFPTISLPFPYHFPPPVTDTDNISTRACAADKHYNIVHIH
jgi:hypothetical protein